MWQPINVLLLFTWPFMVFAQETEPQLYRPFTETDKHPIAIINSKKIGHCSEQARYIKREDAWRCEAEGTIYDPCFISSYGSHHEVICPESPWSSKSVQISVEAPLSNRNFQTLDMSKTYPWALELSQGVKCQAINPGQTYDGLPILYQCDDQSILFGHLQRCSSTWTILKHHLSEVETIEIIKAWF